MGTVPIPQGASLEPLQSQSGAVPIPQGASLEPLNHSAGGLTPEAQKAMNEAGSTPGFDEAHPYLSKALDFAKSAFVDPVIPAAVDMSHKMGQVESDDLDKAYGGQSLDRGVLSRAYHAVHSIAAGTARTAYGIAGMSPGEAALTAGGVATGNPEVPAAYWATKGAGNLIGANAEGKSSVKQALKPNATPEEVGQPFADASMVASAGAGAGGGEYGAKPAIEAVKNTAGDAASAVSPRGMLAGRMNKPMPNEQFTPQQKLEAARAHDINLDLADASGSKLATAAKAATQHGLGASGTFEAAQEHNTSALNNWGNGYLDKLSTNSGEAAGTRIQGALERDLAQKQTRESQIFDELDNSKSAIKPDSSPIRQTAQKIIDSESSYYQKHPDAIPPKAWKWVQNAAKDSGDTWSDIHKLRSDTMALYRSPDVVGTRAEGFLKQLVKSQDDVLTSPDLSKMSPQDVSNFRDANEIHTDIKSTYDNPQHPFYHALRTPFASKSAEMMAGKTPELARQTNVVLGPNAGDFQRSVVENIMGRNPSGAGFDFKAMSNRLKNYKPEYLQSLLGSAATSELYKMARIGRDVTADSNPSGSGKVLQRAREGAEVVTAPLALASGHPAIAAGAAAVPAAEWGIAKTLTNPKVVDFLTQKKPARGTISNSMPQQRR